MDKGSELMNEAGRMKRVTALGSVVTRLSTLAMAASAAVVAVSGLSGCVSKELPPGAACGLGTSLKDGQCLLTECPPGTRANVAGTACEAIPDPCEGATCSAGPGVAEVIPTAQGTACMCVATACLDGYENPTQGCPKIADCPPGYRQEGAVCVPEEDVSCYDVPSSPLCIPTDCADQPTSSAASGGVDLQPLGKCVVRQVVAEQSCTTNCHSGIEDPHPWFGGPDLTCTGCHGGNPEATSQAAAHVPIPALWQANSPQLGRPNLRYYWNYNTLFGVENFEGGLEWLRFRNPSDLRVAENSCGKSAGCHQDRVSNVQRSVMATEVGLVGVAQARAGIARSIIRGDGGGVYKWDTTEGQTLGRAEGLTATAYDSSYTGSVQKLDRFVIKNREFNGAYSQVDVLKELYDKQCGDCHLGNAGANNRYADFRSSGCASCHMTYALDGKSRSGDTFIRKDEPTYPAAYAQIANFDANDLQNLNGAWLGPERAHPAYHRLTRQMSSQRCGTCHVGSNRTDWQFRGYQIDPNRTAVTALAAGTINANQVKFTDEIDNNANPFARYHGQAQDQVLAYVDWDNDGTDDIPADIHYQAGLECMDCHTTGEMHNELKFVKQKKVLDWTDENQVKDMSGAIWSHMDQSTEIECVHCHGNLEYRAAPFDVDNRNPIRNLIACAEVGETLTWDDDSDPATPEVTYNPAECARLGRGRFLRSKFTDRWHYVPQTKDTVADVGITWPNGSPLYSANASIFHGRYDQDLSNGVGPCPNGDINNCFKDQTQNAVRVTTGFSHLGAPATSPVDQQQGGLECYTCHATWQNGCFGCHLTLADTDGNNTLRDFARSTGEYTYGVVAQADFTYITPRDIQYGINSEGKIAQFEPETKMHIRHINADNVDYFPNVVATQNDSVYNVYRDRAGYGLRQYATEQVGLPPNSDGVYEQYAQMDNNAGQGFNQFVPHSIQRSSVYMDCTNCHLDAATNGANADLVRARFGIGNVANGGGYINNTSAYLTALNGLDIVRNNTNQAVTVNAAAGFRFDEIIDPDGYAVEQQADWVVEETDGFPYAYNNHPLKQGTYGFAFNPQYARTFPVMAPIAGPLNKFLIDKMLIQVKVANEGVQNRGAR